MTALLDSKRDRIDAFCMKWGIRELALFGSAVRDDFRPDSDFDFLVSFSPSVAWGLLDHAVMERELAEIVGRPVWIGNSIAATQQGGRPGVAPKPMTASHPHKTTRADARPWF